MTERFRVGGGVPNSVGMLDDAGFTDIEVREIEDDPINLHYLATK